MRGKNEMDYPWRVGREGFARKDYMSSNSSAYSSIQRYQRSVLIIMNSS